MRGIVQRTNERTIGSTQRSPRRRTATVLTALLLCSGTLASALPATSASAEISASPAGWAVVGAGLFHNCGVGDDGTLWCWGENYAGRLGTGDQNGRNHPVRVDPITTWSSAVGGADHTCALRSNHSLYCWGGDGYGQLGVGRRDFARLVPEHVTAGPTAGWASVSLGDLYTCGVDVHHRFWCWGHDQDSVLGDGGNQSQTVPELIGTRREWAQVSANASGLHTCALKLDGTLWCWGVGKKGQLGMGSRARIRIPAQVGTDTDWTSVSVGGSMTCATKVDHTLWCWGSHKAGELGTGDRKDQLSPQQVGEATNWSSVSVGYLHACATRLDGSLWCWGFNWDGEVGDGTTENRSTPVQIGAASGWGTPSVGRAHSCATWMNDTLWCWGDNREGQLGNGDFAGQSLIPSQVVS